MWRDSRTTAERWLHVLLHTRDTPTRTAAAFGLGVAIGFSPFLGFHTAIGLALAFALGLNRVAVVAGLWANLPWIMGPYYAAATALGAWLLDTAPPPKPMEQLLDIWALSGWGERVSAFFDLVRPLIWPFTLGSLIGAVTLGFIAYRLTLPVIVAHRRRMAHHGPESGRIKDDKSFEHNN